MRPAAVIHTAYRQDGDGARETTVDGAEAVAAAAREAGARLVHMSSDVIFDGRKPAPYAEDDPPSPITDYGRAKADAERLVAAAHPDAVLVRTSLIYGGDGESRHERLALQAAGGDDAARVLRRRAPLPGAGGGPRRRAARAGGPPGAGSAQRGRLRGGDPLRVRLPRRRAPAGSAWRRSAAPRSPRPGSSAHGTVRSTRDAPGGCCALPCAGPASGSRAPPADPPPPPTAEVATMGVWKIGLSGWRRPA